MKALIGHTGFVGSNLLRQTEFDAVYNSKTIGDLAGKKYNLVVCAGVSATMWRANNDPQGDWKAIETLIAALEQAQIGRLVLISTVAVLDDLAAGYSEGNAHFEAKLAYGVHRRELETRVSELFGRSHVVRLPALFGPGLKKNFVFDLMNPIPSFLKDEAFEALKARLRPELSSFAVRAFTFDPSVGMWKLDRDGAGRAPEAPALAAAMKERLEDSRRFTRHDSTFQFYDLTRLWDDLQRCIDYELDTLHLTSEPLEAVVIAKALTGSAFENTEPAQIVQNVRTDHAGLWNADGHYQYTANETLDALKRFIQRDLST